MAVGEVLSTSIWDCKQLIEEQLIDYIRTTLTMQAELPVCAKLQILLRCIRYVLAHTVHRLSPVCMAAALHFDLGVPISVSRYMGYSERMLEVFRTTGLSITAICIRETNRVLASNSMKSWRRNIL
ncbi:hypothetical protein ACVXHA_12690 [Escherichia coli]